ncbi:MAG: hypothetical protein M3Q07_14185 [Pseudobdellovibrionaceae bacterium]|nr:hypothetical protein [Pseudobdellovibrionaceae bacterium]
MSQILKTPPAAGCLGFSKIQQAAATSSLLAIENQVAAGLSSKIAEQIVQPRHEFIRNAIDRCAHPKDISAPNAANDNVISLCVRFKNQGAGAESVLLNSPHAFGEFRFELINSQNNQPISCDEYRNSRQAGVNVYYSIYWINGKFPDSGYSSHTGYYYVGR